MLEVVNFWNLVLYFCLVYFLLLVYANLTKGKCLVRRDLTGKVAIITGANTGIGYETALSLAKNGCTVYVACRKAEETPAEPDPNETVAKIRRLSENEKVHILEMDVSLMTSIEKAVRTFLKKEDRLDILINNAGFLGKGNERSETREGLETVMATNYFGHFQLTKTLIPLLEKSQGRVINMSSIAHMWGTFNPSDLNYDNSFPSGYLNNMVYGTSKLCIAMFSKELSLRHPLVRVASVHPGLVWSPMVTGLPWYAVIFLGLSSLLFKNVRDGAQTTLYLSLCPDFESGHHWADCKKAILVRGEVNNGEKRNMLWEATEKMLKYL